jgi:hypothetical protein
VFRFMAAAAKANLPDLCVWILFNFYILHLGKIVINGMQSLVDFEVLDLEEESEGKLVIYVLGLKSILKLCVCSLQIIKTRWCQCVSLVLRLALVRCATVHRGVTLELTRVNFTLNKFEYC